MPVIRNTSFGGLGQPSRAASCHHPKYQIKLTRFNFKFAKIATFNDRAQYKNILLDKIQVECPLTWKPTLEKGTSEIRIEVKIQL